MKPMRMLILLAVFWAAGSLLLAAESPSTSAPKPAATAKKAESGTQGDTKSGAKPDAKTDSKEASKDGDKPSIAEQAEAALKAANEADPGAASRAPPKSEEQAAQDDTQTPPTGTAAKGPSPQRFVPTEQVRADFDVSFPIDI